MRTDQLIQAQISFPLFPLKTSSAETPAAAFAEAADTPPHTHTHPPADTPLIPSCLSLQGNKVSFVQRTWCLVMFGADTEAPLTHMPTTVMPHTVPTMTLCPATGPDNKPTS